MRPEEYRGVIRKMENYIRRITLLLDGKTENNAQIAVYDLDELDDCIATCSKYEGELLIYIKSLRQNSVKAKDYEECRGKLIECRDELKALRERIIGS